MTLFHIKRILNMFEGKVTNMLQKHYREMRFRCFKRIEVNKVLFIKKAVRYYSDSFFI